MCVCTSAVPLGATRLLGGSASDRSLSKSTGTDHQSSVLFRSMDRRFVALVSVYQLPGTWHLSEILVQLRMWICPAHCGWIQLGMALQSGNLDSGKTVLLLQRE